MGTIVFIDGFDDYAAVDGTLHGWTNDAFFAMVAGRVTGNALYLPGATGQSDIRRAVAADAEYTASCAMALDDAGVGAGVPVRWREGATIHGSVVYNGDGTFSVTNGAGTVLETSGNCGIGTGVWFTLEFNYKVDDGNGHYELRINKSVVIGPTAGIDTRNGGTGVITVFNMAPVGANKGLIVDDLILTKGGGFQGDLRIVTQMPDGDGANTDWTAVPYGTPVYVAQTAASSPSAGTVAWPGHVANDVALLLVEAAGGEAITLSIPSGFVEVTNSPQATGAGTAGVRLHAYWCRATHPAMPTVTVADPGDHWSAAMLTFRGCAKTGSPIDVTAGGVKTPATTSFSSPSVTTTMDGALIVASIARDDDIATAEFSAWTNAGLASIAEVFDLGTTLGNGGGIGVGVGIKTAAGATGATTGTVVSSINASITIALAPVPAGDFGQVNDITEDGDLSYLTSATATDRDTFTFPDVGVVGTVKAVAINHVSRKDDAGTRKIATSVRAGGTDYDGTGVEVSTSWAAYQEIREVDPSTTDPWDVTDIDAAEFGIYLDT